MKNPLSEHMQNFHCAMRRRQVLLPYSFVVCLVLATLCWEVGAQLVVIPNTESVLSSERKVASEPVALLPPFSALQH